MSMDHVVVGGGHFVERGGQLVQEFVEKGPDLMHVFNRATEGLNYTQHVQRSIQDRHLEHLDRISQRMSSGNRQAVIRLISDGNDNNFVDFTGADRGTDGGVDRSWGTMEHHSQNSRQVVEYDRHKEFFDKQAAGKDEVIKDLAESIGWAAAGDFGQAAEKGVEALGKQGQLWYESTVQLFDVLFGGDK